jgi:hypothetical protein
VLCQGDDAEYKPILREISEIPEKYNHWFSLAEQSQIRKRSQP